MGAKNIKDYKIGDRVSGIAADIAGSYTRVTGKIIETDEPHPTQRLRIEAEADFDWVYAGMPTWIIDSTVEEA